MLTPDELKRRGQQACRQWAARLRALRLRQGWRQQDIAVHAGITRTQYCAIEQGRCIVNFVHLYKLSRAFGFTIAELLELQVCPRRDLGRSDGSKSVLRAHRVNRRHARSTAATVASVSRA